ncbi:MAG: 1-(5-phosphoribosyl)-5-[(5-phosphoribosylamino)methylideneamino]imidazole-4-carboxamide isomerase [Planctomycetales bacterium]|nr:1-(5-phosphoribosyl)-5-[(5-phosphoribosylamino)methylideneamino]imidazole-4-carboxamide isomerase [Planctomycetales bacterium]
MQIWPAIDLRGGKCVRLMQGDYDRETVYGDDPAATARRWVGEGAEHLHLVDLDGARDGALVNRQAIADIVRATDVPTELGGGVREATTVDALLELGLARVVIGTKAIREPDWLREICRQFPQRIVLGIDARDGRVATDGWLETSDMSAAELARAFDDEPLAAIVYTDIATDGMLQGPNVAAMGEMAQAVDTPVIASGGVTTREDIRRLKAVGVAGCIVGRALYEGKLTVAQAIAAANE